MQIRVDISPRELAIIIRRALCNHFPIQEDNIKIQFDGELPGLTVEAEERVND